VTITTIERKRYDCQTNSEKDIFWAENEVFQARTGEVFNGMFKIGQVPGLSAGKAADSQQRKHSHRE
jgi:hypothetical protein